MLRVVFLWGGFKHWVRLKHRLTVGTGALFVAFHGLVLATLAAFKFISRTAKRACQGTPCVWHQVQGQVCVSFGVLPRAAPSAQRQHVIAVLMLGQLGLALVARALAAPATVWFQATVRDDQQLPAIIRFSQKSWLAHCLTNPLTYNQCQAWVANSNQQHGATERPFGFGRDSYPSRTCGERLHLAVTADKPCQPELMLSRLQLREFIHEHPSIGDAEYSFRQALTHEVYGFDSNRPARKMDSSLKQ